MSVPGLEWVAEDEVWSAKEHLDWMEKALVWVAETDESGLVGFLITQIFDDELHIWEISVHASAQGKGLGKRFLKTAIGYAKKADLSALTLTTFRDLKFNEKFYAKHGFFSLETGQISQRLQDALLNEQNDGLPIERRCAMQLSL